MQQICFLTVQEPWWSDRGAIWALALVQREAGGGTKTRCDGKLLIHLLIKGHFLSAIRGWRPAYLGLGLLFYLASLLPSVSHRAVVKNSDTRQRSMLRKHYLIAAGVWHVCTGPCFDPVFHCTVTVNQTVTHKHKETLFTQTVEELDRVREVSMSRTETCKQREMGRWMTCPDFSQHDELPVLDQSPGWDWLNQLLLIHHRPTMLTILFNLNLFFLSAFSEILTEFL